MDPPMENAPHPAGFAPNEIGVRLLYNTNSYTVNVDSMVWLSKCINSAASQILKYLTISKLTQI